MNLQTDIGKLLLRLLVGVLLLFHGYAKLRHGVGSIEGLFSKHGIPSILAYSVFIGEILAPIMLIIGYRVRIAGFLIMVTMFVAATTAHLKDLISITGHGALTLESIYFYTFCSLAICFMGAGRFSIDKR